MQRRTIKTVYVALIWLVGCLSFSLAQDINYTKKGKILSEGETPTTGGEVEVKAYRLELIKLDKPFPVAGKKQPLEKAFRLVLVTKDDLFLDDISFWIDDSPYW